MIGRWMAGAALLGLLTMPALTWAHEGHAHQVLGTIAAVTDAQLDVKTTDGKVVAVTLDAKTVYRLGKVKADAAMLKTGERVVVEAEQPAGAKLMTAKTVTMAAPTTAAVRK
jgi:IS5 family transposase